jgi:hypothetical protein
MQRGSSKLAFGQASEWNLSQIDVLNFQILRKWGTGMTANNYSDDADFIGRETILGCPQCNGVLYEEQGAESARFRCRRGHVVTLDEILPGAEFTLKGMLSDAVDALINRR